MNKKIEFEKVKDEWIATEFQWINGVYRPINSVRELSEDAIIKRISAEVKRGHSQITITEDGD